MKIVAFLPVKGTIERIENKNTTLMDGKLLFLHTLEKLMRYPFIGEVYFDTEKSEIYNIAQYTDSVIVVIRGISKYTDPIDIVNNIGAF